MYHYSTSLFIFRRDLRLHDNTALHEALRLSGQVIAAFMFDLRQIEPHAYQSKPGLQFLLQSLRDLDLQLRAKGGKLAYFYGQPEQVVSELAAQHAIDAVFFNRDYTPFSRRRDDELAAVCQTLGLALHCLPDALLNEPEQAVKSDGTPYKVFTAFYNHAKQLPVALPRALPQQNFLVFETGFSLEQLGLAQADTVLKGGRTQALLELDNLGACAEYAVLRDFPAINATSHLSAHLKFGTCSVREVFYAVIDQLGSEHPLLRQLYWRDFFTHIAFHFPEVFGHAFLKQFDALCWKNNPTYFKAWSEGKTGFPIVDAGMRELNVTGNMHNRVRMIVASFLIKDLHISWRWGERYFAQHLLDYDPCLNNGNWQWAASTGCDAQPYFRIFNPWLQQAKFDADCRYIFKWVPELRGFEPKIIHQWDKKHQACAYSAPIVNHAQQVLLTKTLYEQAVLLSRQR